MHSLDACGLETRMNQSSNAQTIVVAAEMSRHHKWERRGPHELTSLLRCGPHANPFVERLVYTVHSSQTGKNQKNLRTPDTAQTEMCHQISVSQ